MVRFTGMREFLRKLRRTYLRNAIVSNGEELRRLRVERMHFIGAGISDEYLEEQIERRERRHDQLLTKFKEAPDVRH
jgi:hypothetical protein